MTESKNETFPMVPDSQWWTLRKRFKQSMPSGEIDANALSIVLGVNEKTVRSTVISNLKRIGLLEQDGKVSDLARRWRDDEQYADACAEMLAKVYPESLRLAVPDPVSDIEGAKRWFANRTGGGESAARKMAHTYRLIAEADVSKGLDIPKVMKAAQATGKKAASDKSAQKEQVARTKEVPLVKLTLPAEEIQNSTEPTPQRNTASPTNPSIALHFHLPSDAPANYIETVFGALNKQLSGKIDVIIAPTSVV